MSRILQDLYRDRFLVCVCLILCGVYYFSFVNRALVELTIDVEKRTYFQIFFAEKGEPYSAKHQAKVLVRPDKKTYSFYLTDLDGLERLRIDPHTYVGTSTINRLVISQKGWEPLNFAKTGFNSIHSLENIGHSQADDSKLVTTSTTKDPQLEFFLSLKKTQFGWQQEILRLLVLFSFLYIAGTLCSGLLSQEFYIPFLLAGVLCLVLVMAMNSERDVHPDEYVHLAAAEYYSSNWLPPDVESDEMRDTYSRYGVSRLNGNEIYYFISGKFSVLLQPFQLSEHLTLRLFNVLMLAVIMLIAVKYPGSRIIIAPLLISPQLWYVVSYCNSDGFAVFVCMLAGWQVVDKESLFSRYLFNDRHDRVGSVVVIGVMSVLFGMLVMLKKNYYPVLLFLFCILLVKLWSERERWDIRTLVVRLLIICMLGMSIFGAKVAADLYVNGFDRSSKIAAMRVKMAEPMFNPETPVDKRHVYLSMKERGVTLEKILNVHRWAEKTFRSAFGVYGYHTVSATYVLYDLFRWAGLALLCYVAGSVLIFGELQERMLLCVAVILSAVLIGFALNHSWTNDFQAQGRYLFPVALMLAGGVALAEKTLNRKILCTLLLSLCALSTYSFIMVGLHGLT